MGTIVHDFPHTSQCKVSRNGTPQTLDTKSNVLLTTDGLIATEVPDCATSDEEALILLSSHLSTFLSKLNLGGIYFFPISEKNVAHVELKKELLSQVSGGGDGYSAVSIERALSSLYYSLPTRNTRH